MRRALALGAGSPVVWPALAGGGGTACTAAAEDLADATPADCRRGGASSVREQAARSTQTAALHIEFISLGRAQLSR
jgi:hypothetical protein